MIGKPIEGIRAAGSKDDANCAASSIRDRGDGCRALDVGYSCRLRSPLGPGYVVVGSSVSALVTYYSVLRLLHYRFVTVWSW